MRTDNSNSLELNSVEKKVYIDALIDYLLVLRTKAGLTQEQIANLIGISRQTYNAVETKQRDMSWSVYISLVFIFDSINSTHDFIRIVNAFPESLIKKINSNDIAEEHKNENH